MQLRSIIVDDEEIGIETLKLILGKHVPEVKVVAESTSPKDAIELIEDYRPDIVFLDISMPEMNGFELLSKLSWKKFHLVFTTAHQEYGLKALKQDALDYLLKPVDYRELQIAVNRIIEKIATQKDNFLAFDFSVLSSLNQLYSVKLAIPSKLSIESVNALDIISLESKSNYTEFFLNDSKTIFSPKTLKEFDALLCDNFTFMRVHHSFIINLHKISRFTKEDNVICMTNGQKIHLARSRKDTFMKWLSV